MTRHAATLRLRPEHEAEYLRLHREVWPAVLARIASSNIRNYSIFLHAGVLFSYFEYIGTDFAADMAAIAADPETQRWWALVGPMQHPYEDRAEGEWWSSMEEVFHVD
jgi:L-rhamnose mutarotase